MPIAEIQPALIIAISATFLLRLSLVSSGFMLRDDERDGLLATHAFLRVIFSGPDTWRSSRPLCSKNIIFASFRFAKVSKVMMCMGLGDGNFP